MKHPPLAASDWAVTPDRPACEEIDATLARMAGVDQFCSSSLWTLPARESFHPQARPLMLRGQDGWLVGAVTERLDGVRVLHPGEATWLLACPLIGADPRRLAAQCAQQLTGLGSTWDIAVLAGMAYGSRLLHELVAALAPRYGVAHGPRTSRRQASLAGGMDGWLARRPRALRRGLRRAQRVARDKGLRFEPWSPACGASADQLYARIQAIEARSWKGLAHDGISVEPMRAFYRAMLPRLIERGCLELGFARLGERDAGYILGATWLGSYRGLQFSYDHELAALGVGNLLQLWQLAALIERGVTLYDLGIDIEYKRRWGELDSSTVAVLVRQARPPRA